MHRLGDARDRARAIGSAGCGCGEVAEIPLRVRAVGIVRPLSRVLRTQGAHQRARRIRVVQTKKFAAAAQLEVGVKPVCAGRIPDVQPRGEDDEILARLNNLAGKHPQAGQLAVIAQGPARQINRGAAAIAKFNPRQRVRVCRGGCGIGQAILILRQDFVDHDIVRGGVRIHGVVPRGGDVGIGRRGLIGDPVTARPLHRQQACGLAGKLEDIRAARLPRDIGRRLVVDQQVSRIHAVHLFAEGHLDLAQLAHGQPRLREQGHHRRSNDVLQRVGPGRARAGGIERIHAQPRVGDAVPRNPGDRNIAIGGLAEGEGVVRAAAGNAGGGLLVVEQHVAHAHALHRLGEGHIHRGQRGHGARRRTDVHDGWSVRFARKRGEREIKSKIAAAERGVEDLHRDQIRPFAEEAGGPADAGGDEYGRIHRLVKGERLVAEGAGIHVHPQHFDAVDPDHDSVVDEVGRLQGAELREVGHHEFPPQKDAGIIVQHVRELGAAGPHVAIPERSRRVGELRIRKVVGAPERVVRRGRLVGAPEEAPGRVGGKQFRSAGGNSA